MFTRWGVFWGLLLVVTIPVVAMGDEPEEDSPASRFRIEAAAGAALPFGRTEFRKYWRRGVSAAVGLNYELTRTTFGLLADVQSFAAKSYELAQYLGFGSANFDGGRVTLFSLTANVKSLVSEPRRERIIYTLAGIGIHRTKVKAGTIRGLGQVKLPVTDRTGAAFQIGAGMEFRTARGKANPFIEGRINFGIQRRVDGPGAEAYNSFVLRLGVRGSL